MVNVDPNFHTLVQSDTVQTRVRIYFIDDSVDCTNDNEVMNNGTLLVYEQGDTDSDRRISQDGLTLRELFNKETDIQMGETLSSELDITFVNDDGGLDNFNFGRCKVFLDAYDSALDIWYPCSLGVFIVDTPIRRKVQLIESVAYDQMQLLDTIADEWFSNLGWADGITLYELVTEMASQLGLHVSNTTESSMVNSDLEFTTQPFFPTEMTYREILAWIAGASCTYARFNRDGYLDLAWYSASANLADVNSDTVVVGKYIDGSGATPDNNRNFYYAPYIKVDPNTQYTLSVSEPLYFVSIAEYEADKTFVVRNTKSSNVTEFSITTGADTEYIRFGSNMSNTPITLADVLAVNWMLNKGNALPYETPTFTINADNLGNNCLKIDPSEYQVAQIDKLQVLGTESDVGVILGSGTNAYKILNNGFLFGADEAEITVKATPIYTRLSSFASYYPVATTIITDWSVCAGDIMSITYDGITYSVPIFQQNLSWRGSFVKSELFSSGNPNRTELSAVNRSEYRAGRKVHTLENTVDSLVSIISDMEGNLSSIAQTISDITSRVQDAEGNITQLQQTSTNITTTVQGLNTSLTNVTNDVSSLWTFASTAHVEDSGETVNLSKYIRFDNGDMVLGTSDSDMKLRLESDQIVFFTGEDFDENATIYAKFSPTEFFDAIVKALNSVYVGDDSGTNNFKQSKTVYNGVGEFTISRI